MRDGRSLHISALTQLGSSIWLHRISHFNYLPTFEFAADAITVVGAGMSRISATFFESAKIPSGEPVTQELEF